MIRDYVPEPWKSMTEEQAKAMTPDQVKAMLEAVSTPEFDEFKSAIKTAPSSVLLSFFMNPDGCIAMIFTAMPTKDEELGFISAAVGLAIANEIDRRWPTP